MVMVFPILGTAVSPSTGLRPATVMGNKTRTALPRSRNGDANGSTQQAEYPVVEGNARPRSQLDGYRRRVTRKRL